MQPVVCFLTLGELVDQLRSRGACNDDHLSRLAGHGGRSSVVCYDLLQREGLRLRAVEAAASCRGGLSALSLALDELGLRVSATAMAASAEAVARRQALFRSGGQPTFLDVARDSPEWHAVAARCGEHLELERVQLVHNPVLAHQYESFKKRMAMKPYFSGVNERVLFHGTGRTNPAVVCLGTEGLDPRCATHGNYGCASYFSTTPNYSAAHYSYAPPLGAAAPSLRPVHAQPQQLQQLQQQQQQQQQQEISADMLGPHPRQLLLARVACGNICDYENRIDQSLTRPPAMDLMGAVLFDSVMAGPFSSRSSLMHMVAVYDKQQALPEHLVTFRFRSSFAEANRPRPLPEALAAPDALPPLPFHAANDEFFLAPLPPPPSSSSTLVRPTALLPLASAQQSARAAPGAAAGWSQFAQLSPAGAALLQDLWAISGTMSSSSSAAASSSSASSQTRTRRRRRSSSSSSSSDFAAAAGSRSARQTEGSSRPHSAEAALSTIPKLPSIDADVCDSRRRKRRLVARTDSNG